MKKASTARAIPNGDYDNEEFFTPLLGDDDNVKTLGVIRPGIMVLKKSCEQADVERYDRLLAQGMSWTDMAKEFGDKLIPQNVDYFTANRHDCINPANADLIKKLYADPDGRIRSIPVYFPMNEWWNIIPHRLCCYGLTRGLKHRSGFEYERDDRGRIADYRMVCETPEDLEAGKKLFGGRAWMRKPCDPESCLEYQKEECRFSGQDLLHDPGDKGDGLVCDPDEVMVFHETAEEDASGHVPAHQRKDRLSSPQRRNDLRAPEGESHHSLHRLGEGRDEDEAAIPDRPRCGGGPAGSRKGVFRRKGPPKRGEGDDHAGRGHRGCRTGLRHGYRFGSS